MVTKRFAIFLLTMVILGSCQVSRYVIYNFADIGDYKKFPSRPLYHDTVIFTFHEGYKGRVPATIMDEKEQMIPFDQFLEENKTVAFLIIKNDTILYEKYFRGYDRESVVPSFSMAKSITSILIGCAIDEGLIKNVDEHVTRYIPELSGKGFEKVTIRNLLQMTSGVKFNESYINPFGDAASFYYGQHLRKKISRMKIREAPGQTFSYSSGDSQILGLVLERALKGKTVTSFLQEKLWTPLQMEYDASWSIDQKKDGLEKTFCCINATARDFAKIGRLYENKGNWNGRQIVSPSWVEQSTKIDSTNGSVKYYQYQWWLPSPDGDFSAVGILGQYIYVNPAKHLVIVRLGKKQGKANWLKVMKVLKAFY